MKCAKFWATAGQRFCQIYDITRSGQLRGQEHSPSYPEHLDDWAARLVAESPNDLHEQLAADREQLRLARDQRVRPGRDDKVLTAWNALAIKSLAVGGAVLDRAALHRGGGESGGVHVCPKMTRDDGRLLHAFRGGQGALGCLRR